MALTLKIFTFPSGNTMIKIKCVCGYENLCSNNPWQTNCLECKSALPIRYHMLPQYVGSRMRHHFI